MHSCRAKYVEEPAEQQDSMDVKGNAFLKKSSKT